MTPDEILSAVLDAMGLPAWHGNTRAREIIAAAIREAVAAEREQTAQHVRNLYEGFVALNDTIACRVAGAILNHLVPGVTREGEPVPDAAAIAARIREGAP